MMQRRDEIFWNINELINIKRLSLGAVIGLLFFQVSCVHKGAGRAPLATQIPLPEHCFFEEFVADTFPWPIDQCRNYEEVFKNYEFFETKLDSKSSLLTVFRFKSGNLIQTQRFLVLENLKLSEIKLKLD